MSDYSGLKPGRKPIHGQAMTPAERMQRMRERKAERVRQAEAEAQAERQRQAQLARDCRRAVGAFLGSVPATGNKIIFKNICTASLQDAGWTEGDWPEAQLKIGEIIHALQSRRDRLP